MAKLSKGTDFSVAGTYSGTDLNNLVDAATVLPGFITDWTAVTPVSADSFLFYSAGGATLAKCTLSDILGSITSDAAAGTPSLRSLGTGATQAAAGNDSRFPANVTGIRLGAGGAANDTAAGAKDLNFSSVNLSHGTAVNWDLGDVFYDTGLTSNTTYTFSNVRDGRVIILMINQNAKTVTLPAGWTLLGTANTAGWNMYTFIKSAGNSMATVVN